jgi:S-adenosylmethionine hydrolase
VAVITLTTDFGTRDTYVAEMKGVVLSITSEVHVVDVTHEVAPGDALAGALALEAAAPRFPAGTIHVAVVDPGVGTARRGLVIAARDQLFVGPDNGLFTPFLDAGRWQAFELLANEFRGPEVSSTFHGRDVFAPAAAHLARGLDPARLGPPVGDPVRLAWPEVRVSEGRVGGAVLHVDRFGNLVTSIRAEAIAALGSGLAVRVAGKSLPLVRTYGDLGRGDPGALVGSSNRLEIAVNSGSAAKALRAGRGTQVVVSRTSSSRKRRTRGRT